MHLRNIKENGWTRRVANGLGLGITGGNREMVRQVSGELLVNNYENGHYIISGIDL